MVSKGETQYPKLIKPRNEVARMVSQVARKYSQIAKKVSLPALRTGRLPQLVPLKAKIAMTSFDDLFYLINLQYRRTDLSTYLTAPI